MKINAEDIENIIISRTDKIGDIILTLPLISECKRIFKNAKITFLTNSIVKELISGYDDIDYIIYYDEFNSFFDKFSRIKSGTYDISISVYPRLEIALLFYFAGIKIRVGTAYRGYSFLFNKKVKEHRKFAVKHEAQYNLNLLKIISDDVRNEFNYKFGYSIAERNALRNKLSGLKFDMNEKFIIVHPGSKGSAADIPVKTLCHFTGNFLNRHKEMKIILTGSEEENETGNIIHEFVNYSEQVIKLNGKINLKELMILVDSSQLFISNSTGPIHIAGALNKKIIGFYPKEKPMTAERWGPLSNHTVIISPEGINSDMNEIKPEDILEASDKLLNK